MRARSLFTLVALLAAGCGASAPAPETTEPVDPGQVHIHGLGLNPADGALFIATHTGLFRTPRDADRAQRVGDSHQDTMGFAIVGPDHFLGSGHPDATQDLPPYLGLIESRDAGRTWTPLSLHGEVDFHVLEAAGTRVYGYGSDFATGEPRFLASDDGGRTWNRLQAPEPLLSLAVSPQEPDVLIASGARGLHRSANAGRTWKRVEAPGPGLLAWTRAGVVLVTFDGSVWRGVGSDRWRPAGTVGGEPAAFDHGEDGTLLVARHDGVVQHSADTGRTWTVRSQP